MPQSGDMQAACDGPRDIKVRLYRERAGRQSPYSLTCELRTSIAGKW
jgi:hypothetical protein